MPASGPCHRNPDEGHRGSPPAREAFPIRAAFVLSILALTSTFALATPYVDGHGPILVDAGTSSQVVSGAPISVAGRATYGHAPYVYLWTYDGLSLRFADPTAATTTFDTTGLSGVVTLTLTVTDAEGEVVADTVKHRIGAAGGISYQFGGSSPVGVPDELLFPTGFDTQEHTFDVPAGTPSITALLDWQFGEDDFDFELIAPDGSSATGTAGQSSAKPEVVSVSNPAPGTWTARVYPFLVVDDAYTLAISGGAGVGGSMPVVFTGIWEFGGLDAQQMLAAAGAGTAPYSFAWDYGNDLTVDATGTHVSAAFPAGEHAFRIRVTDAEGFEADGIGAVHVLGYDHVYQVLCAPHDYFDFYAMEFSASKGTCWMHGGHHTYAFDGAGLSLERVVGFAFAVEQQQSPPTETNASTLTAPLHVEVSTDGLHWTTAGEGDYVLVGTSPISLPNRQEVWFDVDADAAPFRFLRVREPLSAAQGLSGYLDHTQLSVYANETSPPAAAPLAPATRAYACESDIMEDFFVDHPCWFGGVDRYDAPSFFQTYFIGDGATANAISGTFTLGPWRSDDFFLPINPNEDPMRTAAYVQVSTDGVVWKDLAKIGAVYDVEQSFTINLDDEPATYVRLFPEYHVRYDNWQNDPALHHPEGYFLHTSVTVTGDLPTA